MNKENKCFFSISLENGITITGENPYIVRDFLITLEAALYWAAEHYNQEEHNILEENARKLSDMVFYASCTIDNNLKKED